MTTAQTRAGSAPLELPPGEAKALAARLRRAQGQVGAVATMMDEGRACREIVAQLAAAKKALDGAGFALVEATTASCLLDPHFTPSDRQAMRKLFLALS